MIKRDLTRPSVAVHRAGVALLSALALLAESSCRAASSQGDASTSTAGGRAMEGPRPAVIAANEGERRFLRGGAASLLIKVDPVSTGSRRMVLGSSDLSPGDAIGLHRHFREDEIILILHGTARVRLGRADYTATTGGTVFIPQGTCIGITNVGLDTLTNVFIFSSPGGEQLLRDVSTRPGEPPKTLTPAQRSAAFHARHAEAWPTDC